MLTRDTLRREVGNTIYQRGEDLYESGSVWDLQVENGEPSDCIEAQVKGSGNLSYSVYVQYNWAAGFAEEYSCECAAFHNYDGMCKHCAAAILAYIDSRWSHAAEERLQTAKQGQQLPRPAGYTAEHPASRSATGKNRPKTSPAFERLLQQRVLKRTLPITDAANYGRILLIPKLRRENGEAGLEFLVGTEKGRKYIVKNISTFIGALESGENFSYGVGLKFVHTRDAFAQECRGLVDFLLNWNRNKPDPYFSYSYYRYSYAGRQREMSLSDAQVEEFLNAMGGQPFLASVDRQPEKTWQETAEKLQRILTIRGRETGLEISVNIREACRGRQDNFYFLDRKIYRVSREEDDAVQDFLECFQGMDERASLFVAERDVPTFCREVLPSLEQVFTPDYTSFDKADYGIREVSFQIYLDAPEKDCFTCKIYAVYGEERFELLKGATSDASRDMVREMQMGQQVRRYFNQYDTLTGVMALQDDDDMAYELLTKGIPEFQMLGQVFISEALKLVKVSPAPRPTVGVSLMGDLLELRMTAQDFSMEELAEILGKYNRKKKFFRLKNGDFINMEGEAIGALMELKEGLDLSAGQIKSGRIELPKYRALYLDAEAKEWSALGIERNREFKSLIRNMKTVEDSDFELPESLTDVLREYQKRGFLWLRTLKYNGFGGILADEMGLGKTLQVIALFLSETLEAQENRTCLENHGSRDSQENQKLQESRQGSQPLGLVVCPASLVYNWASEISRFAPELPVRMVAGTAQERQSILEGCVAGDILITSYDLLKRDLEFYQPLRFGIQVIDEAQYIKNYTTQAARAVKEIDAGFKLALTGTPIENRLSELWSIFDYLMPGYLYAYGHFKDSYETPIVQNGDDTARARLQKLIRPFVLRRLKKDVLTDLPDKLEENLYACMEGEQQQLYDAHVKRLLLMLDKESEEEFKRGKIQILAELTKLRQLCCDPGLLYEGYGGGSAKLQLCMDIVQNAVSGGHKILLFSQFTTMLERICRELKREKISHYVLTGATGKEERKDLVESFQSDDTKVFCISLRAGGTGLNLTAADIVIHYDPWWNLAVQNQATDRTHRIGQENVVNVYKLIAKDTIEEKITRLQEKKKELAEQLLNAEELGSGSFSRQELLELLG